MKTLAKSGLHAMFAVVAACASVASAAPIEITQTTPTWSSAVDGSNVLYNVANAPYTDVRWGIPLDSGQSGLGFDPANPPSGSYNPDTVFQLGSLRHYNNPISGGSAATSVDLSLLTSVTGATPAQQSFAFRFLIDETPNAEPCAYFSTTPCADKITFQNLDLTSAFTIDGIAYTLELLGFSTDGGATLSNSFISQEGGTNTIGLYAHITEAAKVPEPASLALMGIALVGFGASRRRRA